MAAETLGPDPMIEAAQAAGFNDVPPIDLPRAIESVYPTDFGSVVQTGPTGTAPVYEDTPKLAQTGIGQNDVRADAAADGARRRSGWRTEGAS